MKILVGLGNPGSRYEKTRHNIGFRFIDHLAQSHRIDLTKQDALMVSGRGKICGESVLLVKPQTFMNLSGQAVAKILKSKKALALDDLLVFHDEIDLALGRLKFKKGGSDAGHRGLISITQEVGADYIRFRLGIGRPPGRQDVADYVLENFAADDEEKAQELLATCTVALEEVLAVGLTRAQNRLHRRSDRLDSPK